MNTDDLDSKTDAALNRLFEIEVAGVYNKKGRKRKRRIDYCNDAGAVIRYLDDCACNITRVCGEEGFPETWSVAVFNGLQSGHAEATCFARAACIALIRAKRNGSGP